MNNNFKPSEQQQAVLDWSDNSKGSLILEARAGCGKSSTLLLLVNHLIKKNPRVGIFVGAYNRAIANEFTVKLKESNIDWKNAQANTLHGAGMAAWRKVTGWSPNNSEQYLDDQKVANIYDRKYGSPELKEQMFPFRSMCLKTVSLAKQRAFGVINQIEDHSKWFDIIDHFGLEEDLPEETDMNFIVNTCIDLYKTSLDECYSKIDFDDMILAPLYFKARFWQYDWVMLDEAQDTNPARRALAMAILKPNGRLIAVGDRFQAIYGFTGADSDSLDLIKNQVNANILPLNVTYRCPKKIVQRAQEYVADIVAHENAPEGVERFINYEKDLMFPEDPHLFQESFTTEDVILCRNVRPLVETAYSLLRMKIPCKVEGREIGKNIISIINRWKVVKISALINNVKEYRDKEVAKWLAKEKEQKADEISDRCETIIVLGEQLIRDGKNSVSDLLDFIKNLFGDTKDGEKQKCLTLSTVHKSKGREWNRVYLLGQNAFMPSKWARKKWQQEQERNLVYVAYTRTKNELIHVQMNNN